MKKNNLKRTLALATSAFALSAAFVGCTDYSEFSEADFQRDAKMQEFYNNFVKEFGQPDPNHTWGWGGMTPEAADALLGVTTRAAGDPDASDYEAGGRINVNRNEWCAKNNQTSLLNVYGVPGWPADWDGRYYTQDGTYSNGRYTIYDSQQDNCNMPGDVTEYEILWVSNKVHHLETYPIADLHVSDYYIQGISTNGDYDTEEDYKNGNVAYYGGVGTNGNNYSYNQYKMDMIMAKSLGGENTWTHINNFNADFNYQPNLSGHIGQNSNRNIIYVQSAGTEDFNFHPSQSTEDAFNNYILIELTWDEPLNPDWTKVKTASNPSADYTLEQVLENPSLLGETKPRRGYYLCFDYQTMKSDEGWPMYKGDKVFDNYIMKLTPSYPVQKNRWPKRLMCEDLGNTYDFDFNDAVFDLSFAQNTADPSGQTFDMLVVIRAAGGTMPITVALPPDGLGKNMEIHGLLGGNEIKTPVNVGGASAPPAMYRYKNAFKVNSSDVPMKNIGTEEEPHYVPENNQNVTLLAQMAAAAFKMRIYIQNGSTSYSVSGYELYQGMRGSNGYNNGIKSTNVVPQLFNCSTDAKWTLEGHHIKDAYTYFPNWVVDEQCEYRLRWDETGYYKRGEAEGDLPTIEPHPVGKEWLGSWDFGPKNGGSTSGWIDQSHLWQGQ